MDDEQPRDRSARPWTGGADRCRGGAPGMVAHAVQEEGGERKGGRNIGRIWLDPINYR